ncbi:bifunctional tRNA (5-methylaminomethyl-2-thiouridine)(34)-methyltransferase MnmD/FAD-dependent 5-carboxymethylaminomethyl-2-thiouridine(34) oxidoreductase MnmC [Legionella hackeliae]|uniref:tRNA 5-methylaminomethyl-2-thiouridine biosynthesis bifunctional protein MnmC n=1 Tax=Legionella hackeliae TaxID=449 RepID=A0A0A8UPK1_LEGHA|nr:bifunctional tRNA (5-methylaminomethyl-2-thiouridine)(34)-methyltransferase MnmD/FAD-dependent 5-carboxymethylaminomethyl-2-thiouridine(34) oxidoreductase MnmC [Legionella hackeliae]KTD13944.1 FAD dependent oxidoreductase [Legionella hackeliae]CEK10648.1 tRNA 5-methylaminomethyl-2-thiouridine biosynthesis bifunctional protein mnmC [Includes: tRNA (mnm(5)s(2)U34)-methyltransferase; FAD-dependent cmnm(5)s(2)U34 oxidoreductase] [Legionella hackeliae]STX47393.1 FAD dependent oxidoreductase [Legio
MSSPFVPIETAELTWRNGLPVSAKFDDIYFSTEGGLQETEHVFIVGNRLIERWQLLEKETFVIAETGFGSGLNFLLTWSLWLKYAPKDARLFFISCEKFPLKKEDLARCLALWPQLKTQADALLADYPILTPGFHHLSFENGRINLTLMLGDVFACYSELLVCGDQKLEAQLRTHYVDAWFLDGFSPAKNSAMWSENLFHCISLLSTAGTTLATFSAASLVKNNLQNAGFEVRKSKGFGRKREMTIANYVRMPEHNYHRLRTTPWHVGSPNKVGKKQAIVLGAGLAGCYTAYALSKRNWEVVLLDAGNEVGCGASGNKQAVLYPKLSSYQSPLTLFMLMAFLFASREYSKLLQEHDLGELAGILQLAFNEKECLTQGSLDKWLSVYPELGLLVDCQQASNLAGIELSTNGLFIPQSGWLNSKALCQLLAKAPGIQFIPNTMINEIYAEEGMWHADNYSAEILVITSGYQAAQFPYTSYLPLKPIRGQMTDIESNPHTKELKIPLCGDGHVLPTQNNTHSVGATYHLGITNPNCSAADDETNLLRLKKITPQLVWSNRLKNSWCGIRGATTDYLPVVGPVPNEVEFNQQFATLKTNAKRWLPFPGPYYSGLYLCAGFGSRGLTTIPLAAEWLASLINNDPFFLPKSLVQALSPARFLRKKIIRA